MFEDLLDEHFLSGLVHLQLVITLVPTVNSFLLNTVSLIGEIRSSNKMKGYIFKEYKASRNAHLQMIFYGFLFKQEQVFFLKAHS